MYPRTQLLALVYETLGWGGGSKFRKILVYDWQFTDEKAHSSRSHLEQPEQLWDVVSDTLPLKKQ